MKVPNGVSPLMSNETKDRKRVSVKTQRRLFYSGAFGNGRGAENLLEALVLLGKDSYSIHFQCVGPLMQADYVLKYESTASRYASVIVEFTGNVESTEALTLLCQADVCVCLCDDISQYRWTYPVKMGEYFQAKKHVVATGLPGMRSQAKWAEREDHVVFIENDNAPEAIAAGISESSSTHKMRLVQFDADRICALQCMTKVALRMSVQTTPKAASKFYETEGVRKQGPRVQKKLSGVDGTKLPMGPGL